MKLIIDKAALHKALARAVSVVERRNTIPILSNVLIEAEGDAVWLTATDLDIEVRVPAQATVEAPGAITAPAGLLSDIVRNAPDGAEIALAFDRAADPRMIVKFGRSRYQVPVLPAGDFPRAPDLSGAAEMKIPAVDLKLALTRVGFSISTEEVRYYLKGVFLHLHRAASGPELRLISTDGHRLSYAVLAPPPGADNAPAVIVPSKTVRELRRGLADFVGDVVTEVTTAAVRFTFDGMVIRSKVIDGSFPDYLRLIPDHWDHEFSLPRDLMIAAVQRVSLVSTEKSRSIKLSFGAELLTLQVHNDAGAAVEEIAIDYTGDPFEIGFNARYLLDGLGQTEAETVVLRATGAGDPTRLEPEPDDVEHGQALSILMPLRVG